MQAKETNEPGMELSILNEIRDAEKKAEAMLGKAREEKENIIHDAVIEASKSFSKKSEEIKNSSEKKVAEFREKVKLIREEKTEEGRKLAKQIKSKSSKKADEAADFIIKKFEEMIDA
jgi:V/A-type H+/Na+-transporting ATPase subunit G/H